MPVNHSTMFKRSVLALAIAGLSACTTAPQRDSGIVNEIGSTLGTVGSKTLEVSSRAWHGSLYYLGLDAETRARRKDNALLDEVDLALMEDDAIEDLLNQTQTTASAETTGAVTTPVLTPSEQSPALTLGTPVPAADSEIESVVVAQVAASDYSHEVQSSETLWDIAKSTTGDANNWHIIADINNLAPDASVFPGQTLVIPADMVKPELVTNTTAASEPVLSTSTETAAAPAAPTERLSIPDGSSSSDIVVADAAEPTVDGDLGESGIDPKEGAVPMKLQPTETLWDFAKRTTGDATNWKVIAAQNNFTPKQSTQVWAGQTIYVPDTIIKTPGSDEPVLAAASAENSPSATDRDAIEATTAVIAGTNLLDETQPITIVEAKFQGEGVAAPTETLLAADAQAALQELDENRVILVSGTYYPKAVYHQADFSSSLLMRVSPGTELQVSKAIGPWYEVQTDKGLGYVHSRDIK